MDFVYKVRLEDVENSATNPDIYYNMQLQAIIKSGSDMVKPLSKKKFLSHATCQDSLALREHETYLIMGHVTDVWMVQSDNIYVLSKDTFIMHWPAKEDVDKKNLLAELEAFSEYIYLYGCMP